MAFAFFLCEVLFSSSNSIIGLKIEPDPISKVNQGKRQHHVYRISVILRV